MKIDAGMSGSLGDVAEQAKNLEAQGFDGIVTAELAGVYRGRVSTQACPECSLEGHAIDASFCK